MSDVYEIRHSDACERNKDPILSVLSDYIEGSWRILEIGCGTGQHAVYFADELASKNVTWIPADRPGRLGSIRARRKRADLENLNEPVALDLFDEDLDVDTVDAVVAINVIHIAPWEATDRLFAHARRLFRKQHDGRRGLVYLYGPYKYRDRELEPSNRRFDEMLQSRDPQMGLRYAGDVVERAANHGFELVEDRAMPANNRSLVFRQQPS